MGMTVGSHQVVRLSRGRHAALSEGVCAMELASMLADEPFSDRSPSISPTIGAFLRTYNDGVQPLSGYQPDDYALVHDGWHSNMRRYKVGSIAGGYTTLMNKMIEATDK